MANTSATENETKWGLPIFAAKYRNHAIAILKSSNYHSTIALARTTFQISTAISDSQIRLSSRFHEFGDLWVELTPDVWNEVAPMLKVVEVSTTPRPLGRVVVPEIMQSQQPVNDIQDLTTNGTLVIVHVIGGPVDLPIPIPDACTLSELKKLVFQRETRLPNILAFHYQDIRLDDDTKPLQEYGVINQSVITMMTNIQVYVTTPKRSKVPMRITLYADVSSLKLLIHARLDCPVYEQILMCAGEELVDGTRLGSYPQVSHNCQIVVDLMPIPDHGSNQALHLLCVEVKPAWATDDDDDEDGHLYYVLPTSTILDLKVLIHNLNPISPSRQRLKFQGQTLEDEQNMNEAQVEPGSTLIMHLTSQRT
ncbi:unnamed protein product [Rhizoctonia solani]|uniref:Ubiquitin-like domain-containing protein n=1 Tax=Rhizoctonia solani TaxID=456999 RepID=A0A8H3GQV7_9AGAM|nr:unnamed protein product [Rhizoctonia solani]